MFVFDESECYRQKMVFDSKAKKIVASVDYITIEKMRNR